MLCSLFWYIDGLLIHTTKYSGSHASFVKKIINASWQLRKRKTLMGKELKPCLFVHINVYNTHRYHCRRHQEFPCTSHG